MTAILLAGALATGPALANRIEVRNLPQKEVTVTTDSGEQVVKRVPAKTVVPGEEVIYTIEYANTGDAPADNIVVTSQVPAQMTYRDGSATGQGAEVLFSVDGGQSFAPWNNLYVETADGETRPAGPEDYTHVRFVLTEPVPARAQGTVSYRAVLN